ncbi:hypothetical protein [Nonomuraea salmonea]|uniref:hypothetical protein n=1 Tax=Nonomuraea salmonea TaxID=46181 RepID=UPI002FEC4746
MIDLCAGTGRLAWWARDKWLRRANGEPPRELVCVERNRLYVEVGRRVLPEATWICGDVFDVPGMGLGRFDCAISNPPFGPITARAGSAPRYSGDRFEYHVIDLAADLARRGVFVIPQGSAPFRISGGPYREQTSRELERFHAETGIRMDCGVGIDTTHYEGWRGVSPATEIVTCDFTERETPAAPPAPGAAVRPAGGQMELFAALA